MSNSENAEQQKRVEAFSRKHRAALLTMLFTDMVGSTAIKRSVGDHAAIELFGQHHARIRELVKRFPEAQEIETAGDSFFLVFAKPSDALHFALLMQNSLRQLHHETGQPLLDRVGIHVGEVVTEQRGDDARGFFGVQIDIANRVMSLGGPDQILMSRFAFDSARQMLRGAEIPEIAALTWLSHGSYKIAGVEEPIDVCEVGETGLAALTRPGDSPKGQRLRVDNDEPVLGWRPAPGQLVPHTRWELERILGGGGFGEVWLAQHDKLKQKRVLKFCFNADHVRSLRREVAFFRLLRERFGEHPNIVAIHDVFFDEPPFYLVMDYVAGATLDRWAGARSGANGASLEERLEVVAQVADALQAAHEAGILHRDVKPSNVIVTEQHGVLRAKLTDFGIGQALTPQVLAGITLTQGTRVTHSSDQYSGTPIYMAPEVISGQPSTTRSDLYSLGVVLWQTLTGDFSMPLVVDWHRSIDDPLLRDDLRHCLAGNPAERFGSAQELARRLRALAARRLEAEHREKEAGARERAAYRRGVWRAAALASVVIAIIAGLAVLSLVAWRAERKTARRAALARAAAAVGEARALLAGNIAGRTTHALAALQDAAPEAPEKVAELRNLATQLLTGTDYSHAWRRALPEMNPAIRAVAANGSVAVATRDGGCAILPLNSAGGGATVTLPPADGLAVPRVLALDSAARRLAIVDVEGRCGWWDLAARAFHPFPDRVRAIAFDAAGEQVALGLLADGEAIADLVIRRCSDGAELHRLASRVFPFSREANSLAFNPTGTRLAASSDASHQVLVWDVSKGKLHAQLFHRAAVSDVSWKGERLLAACRDTTLSAWAVEPEREDRFIDAPAARWSGHQWGVEQLATGSAGLVASRDASGEVIVWRAAEGVPLVRFPATADLRTIAFAPGDGLLRQTESALELWIPRQVSARVRIPLPIAGRADFGFSPDGAVVAVATGAALRLYGTQSGRELASVPAPVARSVRFAADGSLLATYRYGAFRWPRVEQNGTWRFGPPVQIVPQTLSGILEVSGDGRRMLFAAGAKAFLVDLFDGAAAQEFETGGPAVELALADDGAEFALVREDGVALIGRSGDAAVSRFEVGGPWLAREGARWRSAARPITVGGNLEAAAVSESAWSLRSGAVEVLRSWEVGPHAVERLRLSSNGLRLGVLWREGTLEIWHLPALHAELAQLGLAWTNPLPTEAAPAKPVAIEISGLPTDPPQ